MADMGHITLSLLAFAPLNTGDWTSSQLGSLKHLTGIHPFCYFGES